MRTRLFAFGTILLASTTACTAQGYDQYPGPNNRGYERRYDDNRPRDDRRYEDRRYDDRRDERRDDRRFDDQRRSQDQDRGRRQQQYNQNVASLQQQHNQGVVALQQQFNQGRINRGQLDAGYRDLQATLDRRIAEEKRAIGQ